MASWFAAARAISSYVVEIRRALHAEPELSFQEHATAARIEAELRSFDLDPRRVTATGVVAEVHGSRPGPIVALRADIDALPIQEETGAAYASIRPGVMHACGHDVHTATLLGAAKLLADRKSELCGTVRLIFQPGEETPPGGAQDMIAAGVLDHVDAIFALHELVNFRAGEVAICPGPFLAAGDEFTIRLACRGGGASNPHRSVDGVLIAAQAIVDLQTIASRRVNPVESVVVSVDTIHGGTKAHVLASQVTLEGTTYTHSLDVRDRLPGLIRRVLDGTLHGWDASYELDYRPGYPPVINDAGMAALLREAAEAELGHEAVRATAPYVAADDMAYYLQRVPGCYFLLGIANPERGISYPAHTARFDVDEAALPVGAAVLAAAAWRFTSPIIPQL